MSSHADGSYITWKGSDSSEPKEPALTPYGMLYIYMKYLNLEYCQIPTCSLNMFIIVTINHYY